MPIRLIVVLFAFAPLAALGQGCGSLKNLYGPFDYRTSKKQLAIVDAYHFTPDVEALRHGATGTLGGDLDYTLRASPNHHRALNAMANLALKLRTGKPRGASYNIECYFDRALRFANDDGLVRIIYGVYLARTNRGQDAVRMFEEAKTYEPTNPNLYYNLGLAYFDLRDYANARKNAQQAYRLGSALPGLRDKLKAAGQWREGNEPERSSDASPKDTPP
jgi:Flp pilus assembly protein TadD